MDSFLRARASKQLIASVNRRAAKLGLKRSEFIRLTLALAVENPTAEPPAAQVQPTQASEVSNAGNRK